MVLDSYSYICLDLIVTDAVSYFSIPVSFGLDPGICFAGQRRSFDAIADP